MSSVAMETTNAGVDTVNELDPAGASLARAVKAPSNPPPVEVMNDDGQGNIATVTTNIVECTTRFDPFDDLDAVIRSFDPPPVLLFE